MIKYQIVIATGLLVALSPALAKDPVPLSAVVADPRPDAAYPAGMSAFVLPAENGAMNAVMYTAAGPGTHPTLLLLHGFPGNEQNLDLAQAARRAGWNVLTLHYRGSWGSPGAFSFQGNLDDARAVLAYVREPANAARLRIDPKRIVLGGHSMGGWVTSQVAGSDPALSGAILISSADMSAPAAAPLATRLDLARSNMEALATTAEGMAEQIAGLGPYSFKAAAPGLAKLPVLVLTSDDGLAPVAEGLVMDLKGRGGRVKIVHADTDHSWNTARIRLQAEILTWLQALPK